MSVLLTGATGFVGMEVLDRYLERSDRHVHLLVRADDDAGAEQRVRETMASLYGSEAAHAGRVTAIAADIEREGLGLPAERRAELAEDVDHAIDELLTLRSRNGSRRRTERTVPRPPLVPV